MSWSTTATLPERQTGPGWTTTATPPSREHGPGWGPLIERHVAFAATGALDAYMATTYPYASPVYSGSGQLSAKVAPRKTVTAAFTSAGGFTSGITGGLYEIKYVAVAFSATTTGLAININDGLSASISGGSSLTDGLSAIVVGGVLDGLYATVSQAVAGAPVAVTAAFSATGSAALSSVTGSQMAEGNLTATIGRAISTNFDQTAVGTMLTAVLAKGFASTALSATGTLSATVTEVTTSFSATASFTADGSLTSGVVPSYGCTAAITSFGILSATAIRSVATAASLSGDGALSATVTAASNAVYVVGTATSSSTTSVALPAHQIGDMIVIHAAINSSSLPTKPAASGTVPAWIDIWGSTGNPTAAMEIRTAYVVATATNHTSGTWTGAQTMVAVVLRGFNTTNPIGGQDNTGINITGTTATAPQPALVNNDGTSLILHAHALGNVTTWDAAPAGYTRLASAIGTSTAADLCLTKRDDSTAVSPLILGTQVSATVYRGSTIEILSNTVPAPRPRFDAVFSGSQPASSASPLAWTHTAIAGSTVLVFTSPDRINETCTGITYDGVAMTLVASQACNNLASNGTLWCFRLTNVPGGTRNVVASFTGAAARSGASLSYTGVTTIGTPGLSYGPSTNDIASLSVTPASATTVVLAVAAGPYASTSSYGGTRRFTAALPGTIIREAANDPTSFDFRFGNSAAWASIAVPLS